MRRVPRSSRVEWSTLCGGERHPVVYIHVYMPAIDRSLSHIVYTCRRLIDLSPIPANVVRRSYEELDEDDEGLHL